MQRRAALGRAATLVRLARHVRRRRRRNGISLTGWSHIAAGMLAALEQLTGARWVHRVFCARCGWSHEYRSGDAITLGAESPCPECGAAVFDSFERVQLASERA